MFTPNLSRAARSLLDWSQTDLATQAGVSLSTVRDFETGKRTPIANNLAAMQKALSEAGVEFIPENGGGAGVRLRKRVGPTDDGLWPQQLTSENTD
jgi:transcriptional regulator with XRE-family HTH domain